MISMHQRHLYRSCGAGKTCVFLHFITKMSDQFLEQQNNIKFCVKFGKNASDTCVMLSEVCGEEATKKAKCF